MTTIEKERKEKKPKKDNDTITINPEILEMVSFDVDFEILPKKEYKIEVEIEKISKNEISKSDFDNLL